MEKLLAMKKLQPRWYERFPRGVPVGIFGMTMAVALLSVFAIERAEDQRQTAQLAQTAQAVASGLERRSNTNTAYLRSSAALFATQQIVEAPLFRTFIRQLHLEGRFVGSDGIGWSLKIDRSDIPMVERIMRAGNKPGFAVRPVPDSGTASVVPVMFLEPESDRNRRAIGFDMYSEATRRTAMNLAERSGQPTASGRVVLAQEARPSALQVFSFTCPSMHCSPQVAAILSRALSIRHSMRRLFWRHLSTQRASMGLACDFTM
jgi:CHASE1-domain containing sensor protein